MPLPKLEGKDLMNDNYLPKSICVSKVHHIKASVDPYTTIKEAVYRTSLERPLDLGSIIKIVKFNALQIKLLKWCSLL